MDVAALWNAAYESVNSVEVDTFSSCYKLFLAMVFGAMVGYERKRKGQTAGVRTFALISMGAALAMILSIYVPQEYLGLKNGDPGRIAAQVVTGVGFLGAGAIIQMRGSVRGLTTAAGIWMVAAIGMSVGVGLYLLSLVATLLILFILVQLERIEHKASLGAQARIIRLKVEGIVDDVDRYRVALGKHGVSMTDYFIDYDFTITETQINIMVLMPDHADQIAMFKDLARIYPTASLTLATQVNI